MSARARIGVVPRATLHESAQHRVHTTSQTRRLAGVLLTVLPVFLVGGALFIVTPVGSWEYTRNPLRQDLWRAAYAHAVGLLILSLVTLRYVDEARLGEFWRQLVRRSIPAAAVLIPFAMFTSVLSTSQVGNRVRRLAVGSLQRSPSLPDVPTIAELGYPGFEVISWWGLLGQAAMSKDIVARLHREIEKAMGSPDAQKRIGALGADIRTNTPADFAAYIRSERAKWGQAIKDSGARID